MIANNFPLTKVDQAAERRRVLAKVYGLLIRLAEQAENKKVADSIPVEAPQEENNLPLKNDVPL